MEKKYVYTYDQDLPRVYQELFNTRSRMTFGKQTRDRMIPNTKQNGLLSSVWNVSTYISSGIKPIEGLVKKK